MGVTLSYTLKFPFGASFSQCPKFHVYAQLMKRIKKVTCINPFGRCEACDLSASCIYHFLSGEHFEAYPGILMRRDFFEKRIFQPGEKWRIDLILLSKVTVYQDYIRAFFEEENMLGEVFYQITDFKRAPLVISGLYSGTLKVETPVMGEEEIANQVLYYAERYGCDVHGTPQLTFEREKILFDENPYWLNGRRITVSGKVGLLRCINLDRMFLKIGIGKTNYIGGGRCHAIETQDYNQE